MIHWQKARGRSRHSFLPLTTFSVRTVYRHSPLKAIFTGPAPFPLGNEECILHFLISKMRNIVMSCVCFSEKVGWPLGQTVVPGSIPLWNGRLPVTFVRCSTSDWRIASNLSCQWVSYKTAPNESLISPLFPSERKGKQDWELIKTHQMFQTVEFL